VTQRRNQSDRYKERIASFLEEWEERGCSDWQQFRNWSVQQVLWDYGLSIPEIEDITSVDGSNDKGIDAWYYDETDEPPRLVLIQAKDSGVTQEDFAKLKDGLSDLVNPEKAVTANQPLREKAAAFRSDMPQHLRVDVYLTSSRIAQQGLRPDEDGSPFDSFEMTLGSSTAEFTYFVRDIKYLVDNLRVVHNNPIEYSFAAGPNSFFEFAGSKFKTVCAALSASDLVRLFHKERQNLFRKNPRYYLGKSTSNKEIKKFLSDRDQQSADFFLYNNGLTCVAHSVRATNEGIYVNDFQIVNGCQTVASLWSAWVDSVEVNDVYVLAKIIENPLAGSSVDKISEDIAERSNTQTPLKAEDWKSNDKRQQELQKKFNLLPQPWFYEIKRGVWGMMSTQDKTDYRIGPKRYRKVGMRELGQVCYAFIGHSAEAMDKAREIFTSDRVYNEVFSENVTPHQLLVPYIVYLEADLQAKRQQREYLRFPVVSAVGSLLSSLAGVPHGYLSASNSEQLLQNDGWVSILVEHSLRSLGRKIDAESQATGRGARAVVRTNAWMGEPIAQALDSINDRLKLERDLGSTGDKALSTMLPFWRT